MPKCHAGRSTSNSPPIHAQSAGVQNKSVTGSDDDKNSWGISTPGICPNNERWGSKAPLGPPVVPEV